MDPQELILALENQRNNAMNQVAEATAAYKILAKQFEAVKAKLAEYEAAEEEVKVKE